MYPNKEIEQRHVIVDGPVERRETVTERTQEGPREISLSPGMIATIALLAILAVCITVYVVNNKNANEAANRQALLEASQANKEQPTVVTPPVQQPQPVIVQPAPAQQAPVIVQQPAPSAAQEKSSPLDDITIQDAITKRLTDESDLSSVTAIVTNGKATLTGTVDTEEKKARAERVVRGVRGVKSVENNLVLIKP